MQITKNNILTRETLNNMAEQAIALMTINDNEATKDLIYTAFRATSITQSQVRNLPYDGGDMVFVPYDIATIIVHKLFLAGYYAWICHDEAGDKDTYVITYRDIRPYPWYAKIHN